jgi:hypothetical protein
MMPVVLDTPELAATLDKVRAQNGLAGFVLRRRRVRWSPRAGVPRADEPAGDDYHDFGTLARVLKTLKLPDGKVSAVVQGVARCKIERVLKKKNVLVAKVVYPSEISVGGDVEIVLSRNVQHLVREIVANSGQYGDEFRTAIMNIDSARTLADFAAAYFVRDAARAPGAARDAGREGASRAGSARSHARGRSAEARQEDPGADLGEDREGPARVLPARADEGDPARAGRGAARRPRRRAARVPDQDHGRPDARLRREARARRAEAAVGAEPGVGRVGGDPHLPRLADHLPVVAREPTTPPTSITRRAS